LYRLRYASCSFLDRSTGAPIGATRWTDLTVEDAEKSIEFQSWPVEGVGCTGRQGVNRDPAGAVAAWFDPS